MRNFWRWYNKHLSLNIAIAAGLFTLQLVHLFWLTSNVVSQKLGFPNFFPVSSFWQWLLIIVDYTEIPAIITTSFLYINDLRSGKNNKALLYLLPLNSQWIHIFWITDEFVVEQFSKSYTPVLTGFLSWTAILKEALKE
ncbi:MAG: hypothetical protein AAB599_03565 [Patescibacteria group bacterium]